ncbi:MAG: phosphoribosylformylglycinamidine synthase subunit PurQ [Bdellovibrionota bacterium]|nr:phosphoribosylformylglycinamidine synthase subunit PurQ [Bdellovibrionota bacterium]
MHKAKVLVFSGNGINCEKESAQAFFDLGAEVDFVRLKNLEAEPEMILKYNILMFPGGFSFGDELGSGQIFSYRLKKSIKPHLDQYLKNKGLILGVCNGFQILSKLGVFSNELALSLSYNKSGRFINRWVNLKVEKNNRCAWLKDIDEDIAMPARHGEGRFVIGGDLENNFQKLLSNGQIVFRYSENINSSDFDIAGICDETGQILGLMPHPEAALKPGINPFGSEKLCQQIFKNAVEYAKA